MGQNLNIGFVGKTPSGKYIALAVDEGGALQPSAGASSYNNAANTAGHQIKTGAGTLVGLTVNTGGTTSTATLYDGTSTAGAKLATVATTALASLTFNAAFATGLFVVLAGSAAADVTVAYR